MMPIITSAATTNYESAYRDYVLTIGKATPTITLQDKEATYTGSPITAGESTRVVAVIELPEGDASSLKSANMKLKKGSDMMETTLF